MIEHGSASGGAWAECAWENCVVMTKPLPLIFNAPRRGKPPVHLADLDADARKQAVSAGRPSGVSGRPVGPALLRRPDPGCRRRCPTSRPAGRQEFVDALLPGVADRGPLHLLRRRRHPQDAVAGARRHADRVRADALPGPDHALRLVPGRLRNGLPVLRHRPGRSATQPVHGGDRRAGPAGRPGRPRRRAWASRDGCPTWCSWAWASRWPTTTGCWPRSR